jgi:hypothetical protein
MNRLGAHARTAIEHPTRFGFETVHPRFRWVDMTVGVSYVLTVNAGYE